MQKALFGSALLVLSFIANAQAQGLEPFARTKGITDEQLQNLQKVLRSQSLDTLSASPLSKPMSENLNLIVRTDPRIVGGEPTTIDQNPWQAALIYGAVSVADRSFELIALALEDAKGGQAGTSNAFQ